MVSLNKLSSCALWNYTEVHMRKMLPAAFYIVAVALLHNLITTKKKLKRELYPFTEMSVTGSLCLFAVLEGGGTAVQCRGCHMLRLQRMEL